MKKEGYLLIGLLIVILIVCLLFLAKKPEHPAAPVLAQNHTNTEILKLHPELGYLVERFNLTREDCAGGIGIYAPDYSSGGPCTTYTPKLERNGTKCTITYEKKQREKCLVT